jgi:hypothetical protein
VDIESVANRWCYSLSVSLGSNVTAFYGQVGGTQYRAAIVRQFGANVYLWTWFDTPGTVIDFDLVAGTRRIFPQTIDTHESLHASGRMPLAS